MIPVPKLDFYDAWLEQYPVPYESRMVDTPFGATHVLISGAELASPLVLIHGASVNALIWAPYLPTLTPHFRTYSLDLPGYPNKSAAKRLPNDGKGLAEWLKHTLDGLGIQKTSMVGISLGGWTTLNFASHYPEYIQRLAVLVPGGVTPVPLVKLIKDSLIARLGGREGRRAFVRRLGVQPLTHEAEDRMITMLERNNLATGILPQVMSDAALQRIRQPTLLIVGSEDYFFPPQQVKTRLQRCLPQLEVVELAECGHLCTAEKPHEIETALLKFLR